MNTRAMYQGTSVLILKALYTKEAILATAYKFTNRCSVEIIDHDDKHYMAKLISLDNCSPEKIASIIPEFLNELIDQELRVDLSHRTGELRKIIVDHAFSPFKSAKSKKKVTT